MAIDQSHTIIQNPSEIWSEDETMAGSSAIFWMGYHLSRLSHGKHVKLLFLDPPPMTCDPKIAMSHGKVILRTLLGFVRK